MFPADNTRLFSDRSWVRPFFLSLSSFDVPSLFTFWLIIRHVCGQVSLGRDCSSLMCPSSCWGGVLLGSSGRLECLASSWGTLSFSLSSSLFDQSFPSLVSNCSSSSSDTVLTVSSEFWSSFFETGFQVVGPGNLTPSEMSSSWRGPRRYFIVPKG